MNASRLGIQNVFFLALLSIFFGCTGTEPAGEETGEDATPENATVVSAGLTLPAGFKATVVVDSVGYGRHIAVNSNGDIYVQLRRLNDGKSTVALRDTDGDSKADQIEYFGDQQGNGIEVYDGHLYTASNTTVYRYPLNGQLVPDVAAGEVIAGGFIDQDQHAAKSITIDNAGNLYVNVGAPSNACMEERRKKGSPGMDPCPQLERQGGIWKFSATQANQDQQQDGSRFATGIRNAVAVEWNPVTNSLFALQHGRDDLHRLFPDMYTDTLSAELPSEEFMEVLEGDDFGWPFCYNDHFAGKKVLAPEYGGDGKVQDRCADAKAPIVAFPGHIGPNDLAFYTGTNYPERYRSGAFIAFHGSWNRAPFRQKGYFVVFQPMNGSQPSGDWEIFADGFSGLDTDEGVRETIYRPTGVAVGPDGAIYISDSMKGKVWKIVYEG